MTRGRFMTELFGDRKKRFYPTESYIKHPEKKPVPHPDNDKIKALVVSLKSVRAAINECKYDLATNIIASLIENVEAPLDCPAEYRPPGIDEAAIKSKVTTMRSIRTAVIGKKYDMAVNIIASLIDTVQAPLDCPQMAQVPRIPNQKAINAAVLKIEAAQEHARNQMFHLGANVIVSVLDSRISDEDFIDAAIQHHLSGKRTPEDERWYLRNNFYVYEEVMKLRPNDKMIQGIYKNCQDRSVQEGFGAD